MRLELPDRDAPVLRLWTRWAALSLRMLRERALWLALLVGLLAMAAAYQSPRSLLVNIGGTLEGVQSPGFHAPERISGTTYRWSSGSSALVFRGLGKPGAPIDVQLQLSSGRGAGSPPLQVQVAANGHRLDPLPLDHTSRSYSLAIDPSWMDASGDLRIEFTSPTFRPSGDQRDLGFTADFARVDLPGGLVIPSATQVLLLLLSGFLVYWLLRMVWLSARGAGLIAALYLLGCAAVIGIHRLLLTIYTNRLVFTLVVALLLVPATETLARLVTRWAGFRRGGSLPEWAWAGFRAVLLVTLLLKVGAILYPSVSIVDAPFHVKYITYMSEGRSWEQFFGKRLASAVMPAEEWGSAKTFIPYSPYFYVVAAPLVKLPAPLTTTVPAVAAGLESLKSAFVFLVGLALGGGLLGVRSRRRVTATTHVPPQVSTLLSGGTPETVAAVALAGMAVYSFIPATFLLQQWGNWPTQLSLWLVTLWVAVTTLFWPSFARPVAWITSTVLLTLTMLSYTVTAVYVSVLAGLAIVLGLIFARHELRRWVALALSLVASIGLAMLIYYGRYVGDILGTTLPTFGQAVETQGKLTTLYPTLADFLFAHLGRAMQSYSLAIPYALGLAGALLLFVRGSNRRVRRRPAPVFGLVAGAGRPLLRESAEQADKAAVTDQYETLGGTWQRIWLLSWLATFVLFTLADYWMDQALKEFWIALPAIAVAGGVWVVALLSRARASRWAPALIAILAATLVWQSVSLWVYRLLFR